MNDKFVLVGKDGEIEAERFGPVWRVWEYRSDNLQNNLEVPHSQIRDFVAHWKANGYPHLQILHGSIGRTA